VVRALREECAEGVEVYIHVCAQYWKNELSRQSAHERIDTFNEGWASASVTQAKDARSRLPMMGKKEKAEP
jgi:hypothetical protein